MAPLVLDTSLSVPLLSTQHPVHPQVVRWWGGREISLPSHAVAETYSVLTRLPGTLSLEPDQAARLISERFGPSLLMRAPTARQLPTRLSDAGIRGGAVYDAIIGLIAVDHNVVLATRDRRAARTYEAVGATVELVRT
jgi:predicted nucleic acid-binding protein